MATKHRDERGGWQSTADGIARNETSTSPRAQSLNAMGQRSTPSQDHLVDRQRRRVRAKSEAPRESSAHSSTRLVDEPAEERRIPLNAIRRSTPRQRTAAAEDRVQAARDPRAIPEEITRRFVQVGNQFHFPDGARAFTDHGNRLTSPSENSEVIKGLISIAQARGWGDITVSGSERFKREGWFAARLAGLDVRGYTPTAFEQGRVVRSLSRSTLPSAGGARSSAAETSSSAPAAAVKEQTREREPKRTTHVGRLVDHGAAPYLHDPRKPMSYYVRIETPRGERDIWGVDLRRAMKDSLTQPQIGDEVGVRTVRSDAVKVLRAQQAADGRVLGEKPHSVHRNAWLIEKRDFFRKRAQAACVLRDPTVDRERAVDAHPELLGTYLQLRAAELTAKRLRDPEDQRRFLASVRTSLADSVARGEPLPPVPLRDPQKVRPQPPAGNTPTMPERDVAPVR